MSGKPKARPPYRDIRAHLPSSRHPEQTAAEGALVTAPQEPLVVTLEEGLMLLAERRDGRRITYEVDTPDGVPCWVAWERYVTLGPADSWVDALEITLEQPVVARDDAAELRAAAEQAREAIVAVLVYQHHVLSNPNKVALNGVANRLRAALAATEGSE